MSALVDIRDLYFRYPGKKRMDVSSHPWILEDISFAIDESSTLGIVGESGSGKSTLVRVLCGLLPVGEGVVRFGGESVGDLLAGDGRAFRRQNQMVFQSPANSLDPRMRIRRAVSEPVRALERREPSTDELRLWLSQVGLGLEMLERFPHQMSGGQLQRVGIARAISVSPRVLYADEPTSALDVSVQAQVLNLLMDLRRRLGLTLVMVSHDLAVVSRLCERIIVMKDGRVVESGDTVEILRAPQQEYTSSLIEAAQAVSLGAGKIEPADAR